jgi:TonB family protein
VIPSLGRNDSAALAVSSGLEMATESPVAASQHAPLPVPAATSIQPPKVRQVGSRVGHAQLAINPLAERYRVQLPHALQRSDQNFDATVNICVAPNGSVVGVKLMRSAGPIIDAQLLHAVSRWRYRPLLENERAVPFCYVLRYQFAGH